MSQISITFDLPPRELSPNGRVHWAAKSKAVKYARLNAMAKSTSSKMRTTHVKFPLAEPVICTQEWFMGKGPGYKPRDCDNALASIKSTIDGCVSAGIIKGDNYKDLKFGECVFHRTKKEHNGECKLVLTFKGSEQ